MSGSLSRTAPLVVIGLALLWFGIDLLRPRRLSDRHLLRTVGAILVVAGAVTLTQAV